jgi:hypothetical protein
MSSDLLSISRVQKQKAPVFIVGEARSGSTLLQRTLELHPTFRPKRVEHHEAKIFSFTNRSHDLEIRKWTGPFDYMLYEREVFGKFLDSIHIIRILHRAMHSALTTWVAVRFPLFYWLGLNHHMVRSFFHHAELARECERIVEKTPNNTRYLRQIKLCYPKSKILYIYRHPVDVYGSYRKVTEELGSGSWTDLNPLEFCARWEERTSIAIRWSERNDFRLVRYEQFVTEPEPEWAEICRFLRVPFVHGPISIQHNPDRHDSYEEYIKGPIVSKTKCYQDYMTDMEAECIENTLSDYLALLDYDRYT